MYIAHFNVSFLFGQKDLLPSIYSYRFWLNWNIEIAWNFELLKQILRLSWGKTIGVSLPSVACGSFCKIFRIFGNKSILGNRNCYLIIVVFKRWRFTIRAKTSTVSLRGKSRSGKMETSCWSCALSSWFRWRRSDWTWSTWKKWSRRSWSWG